MLTLDFLLVSCMLAHSSLAVLATLSITRDNHELTITLVSLPALRPLWAGSKSHSSQPYQQGASAHGPQRLPPSADSRQLNGPPTRSADPPCLTQTTIVRVYNASLPYTSADEGRRPTAGLPFLLRVGTIIPQSAAFRAPLLSGPVLGHPGPSLQPGRGVFYPSRRFWPSLLTPYWSNSHDFKRT